MLQAKAKYASLPLEEQKVAVTNEFTEQDYIDLAVLFNLAWIDYDYIMTHPELKALYDKVDEGGYKRDDVKTVLDAQMWLLNHTFEEHEKINYLLGNGNVEVTVVPYAHPHRPDTQRLRMGERLRQPRQEGGRALQGVPRKRNRRAEGRLGGGERPQRQDP